jgi:hypothetical protein
MVDLAVCGIEVYPVIQRNAICFYTSWQRFFYDADLSNVLKPSYCVEALLLQRHLPLGSTNSRVSLDLTLCSIPFEEPWPRRFDIRTADPSR